MPFDEALERFLRVDPMEIADAPGPKSGRVKAKRQRAERRASLSGKGSAERGS